MKKVHPRHLPALRVLLVVDVISTGLAVAVTGVILSNEGYELWQVIGTQLITGAVCVVGSIRTNRWILDRLQEIDERNGSDSG
jgi:hypothetical protein